MGCIFNSTLERKTPLRSKTAMKRGGKLRPIRKPIKKVGPRALRWMRAWRWLKPRLEAAGRTRCEFGFIPHDCDGFLTPAHSKKRRLIQGPEIYHVALSCLNFHRVLDEQMSHEQMESTVMRAIELHGGLILPERY